MQKKSSGILVSNERLQNVLLNHRLREERFQRGGKSQLFSNDFNRILMNSYRSDNRNHKQVVSIQDNNDKSLH